MADGFLLAVNSMGWMMALNNCLTSPTLKAEPSWLATTIITRQLQDTNVQLPRTLFAATALRYKSKDKVITTMVIRPLDDPT